MSSEDLAVEDSGSSSKGASCGIFPKEIELAMLCRLGKIVKSNTFVPQTQSVLDGVNLSQTIHKLVFDIIQSLDKCSEQPSKINFPQDWLGSPAGLGIAISSTVVFATLALLGNIFDDNDKLLAKRFFAQSWPYIRNSIKIVKNNFKGLRSIFFTIGMFHPEDFTKLFLEIFCITSFFSLLVRGFNTYQIEKRKNLTLNVLPALLKELDALRDSVFVNIPKNRKALQSQLDKFIGLKEKALQQHMSAFVKRSLIVTNIYCGLIDSLYQFMGLSGFIQLSLSALFIACTAFSAVYVFLGVLTRVVDELENQRRLDVQIVEAEWRVAFYRLSLLKTQEPLLDLESEITEAKFALQQAQSELMKRRQFSNGVAIFLGIHAGLYAYSALTTMVLFTITLAGLFSVILPSLMIPILMGLSLICGGIAVFYHCREQSRHRSILAQENQEFERQFLDVMDIKQARMALKSIKQPSKAPWLRTREFLEPVRLMFAGAKKGSGLVEFNYMDRINYDRSPVVAVVAIISMLVHGIIFFLAGLAKYLSKDPEQQNFRPELINANLTPNHTSENTQNTSVKNEEPQNGSVSSHASVGVAEENRVAPSPACLGIGFFNTSCHHTPPSPIVTAASIPSLA